jgi:hypothetical protein
VAESAGHEGVGSTTLNAVPKMSQSGFAGVSRSVCIPEMIAELSFT